MLHCLVNGEATDVVSSHDRGLLYGDGLFETMTVVAGEIPLWPLHVERLKRGCKRLKLQCPSLDLLSKEIAQLTSNIDRAVIKLILTRGSSGRGYAPATDAITTRILQCHPWPQLSRDYWETGVKVIFCQHQLARQPALAGIKHLNRLEQVLARAEWQDPTIQEGLLSDIDGNIIEAVSHNVFVVNDNTVATPDLSHSGVAGVMREYLMSMLHEKGYPLRVAPIPKQTLLAADAVFLCNSIHGIWPVCDLDGKRFFENPVVCDLRDTVARVIPYY